MTKKNIVTTLLFLILLGIALNVMNLYANQNNIPQSSMDAFAQCIASKNMTMYGAEWCPHCKKEKAIFGSSFKYIPYVECPNEPQLCLSKGIKGYPTWITSDGTLYAGEQKLDGLVKISGCEKPV